jgi:hypothetical protein
MPRQPSAATQKAKIFSKGHIIRSQKTFLYAHPLKNGIKKSGSARGTSGLCIVL